jgi:hypothetical protein
MNQPALVGIIPILPHKKRWGVLHVLVDEAQPSIDLGGVIAH